MGRRKKEEEYIVRECLKCRREFKSYEGIHRLCDECNEDNRKVYLPHYVRKPQVEPRPPTE